MGLSVLHAGIWLHHIHAWCLKKLGSLDPLVLLSLMVVNHSVGNGNLNQILCQSNKCS